MSTYICLPGQPFDADITLELVPGGKYELRSRKDGFTLSWTVLRVQPPTLFEHTHVDPGAAVRWQLEPTYEGCKLVLTQSVPDRTAAVERGYIAACTPRPSGSTTPPPLSDLLRLRDRLPDPFDRVREVPLEADDGLAVDLPHRPSAAGRRI